MWKEASVETEHFAIATDGSSVGQWYLELPSLNSRLFVEEKGMVVKAISFTSNHCVDYGMCQYI